MQKWAHKIKNIQEDDQIKLAIVAANNHYAGFGPRTLNIFRMLGLSEAKWEDRVEEEELQVGHAQEKQRTLSDFLS
jgi:hypothetical protein